MYKYGALSATAGASPSLQAINIIIALCLCWVGTYVFWNFHSAHHMMLLDWFQRTLVLIQT